jgi:hypothetical protein
VITLEDNIRERGAMDKLISDCAKAEMSERVKQIICAYVSVLGIVNHIMRIRILLRTGMLLSRLPLIKS